MQSTAHVLKDTVIRDRTGKRYAALQLVLTKLGFAVKSYDDRMASEEAAMNMETQLNASSGPRASYADSVFATLRAKAVKGDVIIVTADWQALVFNYQLKYAG